MATWYTDLAPSLSLTLTHTLNTLSLTLSLTLYHSPPLPCAPAAKEVAFQINHTEKSFHAFAASDSDKENWVRNLTTYISRARETKGDTHTPPAHACTLWATTCE